MTQTLPTHSVDNPDTDNQTPFQSGSAQPGWESPARLPIGFRAPAVASYAEPAPEPDDFLDQLARDYTQEKRPPCRICGRKLVRSEVPAGHGLVAFACGNRQLDRSADPHGHEWHQHYGDSYWVRRRHGDFRVLALIREVRALRAQLQALQRLAFGDLAEPSVDGGLREMAGRRR